MKTSTTVVKESELREFVKMDQEGLERIEDGFARLARGEVTMPPILRVDVPENNGELDVKSAYVRGWDGFAVKMSSGFFNNFQYGLPSASGMMVLVSAETGIPRGVFLDNGYLTDVRTGLAGALTAKYLAPKNPEAVGILGAGAQAKLQLQALKLVRPLKKVYVWNRHLEKARAFADEMSGNLGLEVEARERAEEVVKEADLVVTTTASQEPIVQSEWLHAGLHLTAMGSDAEHKQELHPSVFLKGDRIVCDSQSQVLRLGECHHAADQGVLDENRNGLTELGQLVTGEKKGRDNDSEITLCDLTGTGVQDTAIALLAEQKIQENQVGVEF